MTAGDPVWYLQNIAGGYDYPERVPGVFVRATPRRWIITLELKDGTHKRVAVLPTNVTARVPGEAP